VRESAGTPYHLFVFSNPRERSAALPVFRRGVREEIFRDFHAGNVSSRPFDRRARADFPSIRSRLTEKERRGARLSERGGDARVGRIEQSKRSNRKNGERITRRDGGSRNRRGGEFSLPERGRGSKCTCTCTYKSSRIDAVARRCCPSSLEEARNRDQGEGGRIPRLSITPGAFPGQRARSPRRAKRERSSPPHPIGTRSINVTRRT